MLAQRLDGNTELGGRLGFRQQPIGWAHTQRSALATARRCIIKADERTRVGGRQARQRRPRPQAHPAQVRPLRPRRVHRRANPKGFAVSVYNTGRSPYLHYDFQWRGHRFHGSTKCTTRREAEKVEATEREKAKSLVAQLAAGKTSLRLDDIADRYWIEHGQHSSGAVNIERRL